MAKRILFALVTLILMVSSPALAAKPSAAGGSHGGGGGTSSSNLGADVSYPQCSGSLPTGVAFGIVGVNDGLANNFNPCFASPEFPWAKALSGTATQSTPQLYINTGNPGAVVVQYNVSDWPYNDLLNGSGAAVFNPYANSAGGDCTQVGTTVGGSPYGPDNQACAYMYGYDKAYNDFQQVLPTDSAAAARNWWLDVESSNSWDTGTTGQANNVADLEGMMAAFKDMNVAPQVGVYSTAAQWNTVVGTQPNANGVDLVGSLLPATNWLPGARTEKAAKSNCSLAPLYGTTGGVSLTQYTSGGTDYDYSCR